MILLYTSSGLSFPYCFILLAFYCCSSIDQKCVFVPPIYLLYVSKYYRLLGYKSSVPTTDPKLVRSLRRMSAGLPWQMGSAWIKAQIVAFTSSGFRSPIMIQDLHQPKSRRDATSRPTLRINKNTSHHVIKLKLRFALLSWRASTYASTSISIHYYIRTSHILSLLAFPRQIRT